MAGAAMWGPNIAVHPQDRHVSKMVLLAFLSFYVFSLMDISGLLTKLAKYDRIPVQPIAFGMAALCILPWRRGRSFPPYFTAAWTFWLLFSIGGFLGSYQERSIGDYEVIQLIIKLGISLVGVPMLALRTIVRDKLKMFVKLTILVIASGAAFAMVQVVLPAMFTAWLHEKGRGGGYWVNPNSCAEICAFGLFLSTTCAFRSKTFMNIVRLLLMGGILASMSRGGVAMLFVGAVIYAIAAKQWKTLARVGMGAVIVIVMTLALATLAKQAGMAAVKRIERFTSFTTGGDVGGSTGDRMMLWSAGLTGVMADPIMGRGHRTMDHIVEGRFGPHNYYLFVWGNSGLMGLLAFIFFVLSLFRMGLRCKQTQNRAMICAMSGIIAITALVSHSFINTVYFGPIFATMMLTAYYDLPVTLTAPAASMQHALRPQPRTRPAY
jgi:O-antigen ligase